MATIGGLILSTPHLHNYCDAVTGLVIPIPPKWTGRASIGLSLPLNTLVVQSRQEASGVGPCPPEVATDQQCQESYVTGRRPTTGKTMNV